MIKSLVLEVYMMRVTYSEDFKTAYFNGYKFRRDLKTGYYLSSNKTDAGKRERLHVCVWRFFNGNVPEGYHVHHADGNKMHNDIENLSLMQEGKHLSLHGNRRWEREPEKMLENLIKNAIPASKAWHASEEGRKWHSEHASQIMQNMEKKEYVCKNCGKKFYTLPVGGEKKYCSNACKSAARRKSGVDAERRICAVCGKEFYVDKYIRTKTCSRQCGNILRRGPRNKNVRETAGLQHGS